MKNICKGGSAAKGALKILALPKRECLTHAKIFLWICRSILKTLFRHFKAHFWTPWTLDGYLERVKMALSMALPCIGM